MKTILTLFVLFLFPILISFNSYGGSSDKTICFETDVEWRNNIMYLPNETKPFTGKELCKYENGQNKSKGQIVDGKIDGKYTILFENGQISWEGNYKEGMPNGKIIWWFENGQKKAEAHYKLGKQHGKRTWWFESGKIKSEGNWKDDKRDGIFTNWSEDGQIEKEATFKDDKCISGDCEELDTQEKFGGLGIKITMENGFVKVLSTIEDTPAYKSGIQAGDYITQINDTPVRGLTISEILELIRGKKGTAINLTISRKGVDPFEVEIIRDIIKIQSTKEVQSWTFGIIARYCDDMLDIINQTIEDGDNLETFQYIVKESVYGFLTGLNIWYKEDSGNFKNLWLDIDNENKFYVYSYVINYCKRNPKDKLYKAATDYFLTLPDMSE